MRCRSPKLRLWNLESTNPSRDDLSREIGRTRYSGRLLRVRVADVLQDLCLPLGVPGRITPIDVPKFKGN